MIDACSGCGCAASTFTASFALPAASQGTWTFTTYDDAQGDTGNVTYDFFSFSLFFLILNTV